MVDGYYSSFPDISVEPAVRFFEKLTPHIRLHEESVLSAPVIMREDHIRLKVVYQVLNIGEPVFSDVVYELMHLIRMVIQVCQYLLKRHQKMTLLKDTGRHESGHKAFITRTAASFFAALSPRLRIAAVCNDIRSMNIFSPAGYIFYDLVLFSNKRH